MKAPLEVISFKGRKRTKKLIQQLALATDKEQDQVVWAALNRYKKSLDGERDKTKDELPPGYTQTGNTLGVRE